MKAYKFTLICLDISTIVSSGPMKCWNYFTIPPRSRTHIKTLLGYIKCSRSCLIFCFAFFYLHLKLQKRAVCFHLSQAHLFLIAVKKECFPLITSCSTQKERKVERETVTTKKEISPLPTEREKWGQT